MKKTDVTKYLWIWCCFNTLIIIFLAIIIGIHRDISIIDEKNIDKNTKDIEKIEYYLDKKDSVVVNVYYQK